MVCYVSCVVVCYLMAWQVISTAATHYSYWLQTHYYIVHYTYMTLATQSSVLREAMLSYVEPV